MKENFYNKIDNLKTDFFVTMYFLWVTGLAIHDRQPIRSNLNEALLDLLRETQGLT